MNRLLGWLSEYPLLGWLTVTKSDEMCDPMVAHPWHFRLGVGLFGAIRGIGETMGLILTIRLHNHLTSPKRFNLMCRLLDTWWQDVTLSR